MSAILKFDFQEKKTIRFFRRKLSKLHKEYTILHVSTTIFIKQEQTRTISGPTDYSQKQGIIKKIGFPLKPDDVIVMSSNVHE